LGVYFPGSRLASQESGRQSGFDSLNFGMQISKWRLLVGSLENKPSMVV
jgi:hypothetical protein